MVNDAAERYIGHRLMELLPIEKTNKIQTSSYRKTQTRFSEQIDFIKNITFSKLSN